MMKEFGARFFFQYEDGKQLAIRGIDNFLAYIANPCDGALFYISPESEHIFEPQEGDEVLTIGGHYDRSFCKYPVPENLKIGYTGSYEGGESKIFTGARIIMRDNKQFFMCEVESE